MLLPYTRLSHEFAIFVLRLRANFIFGVVPPVNTVLVNYTQTRKDGEQQPPIYTLRRLNKARCTDLQTQVWGLSIAQYSHASTGTAQSYTQFGAWQITTGWASPLSPMRQPSPPIPLANFDINTVPADLGPFLTVHQTIDSLALTVPIQEMYEALCRQYSHKELHEIYPHESTKPDEGM
jgi:hypothetical protein